MSVGVVEKSSLEHLIVRGFNTRNKVGGSEGNLLCLSVEILGVAVEHDLSDGLQRIVGMRPDLRHIVDIKAVSISVGNGHNLDKPVPGGGASIEERFMQVASGKVLVLHTLLGGLSISEVLDALSGLEVVLNQECLPFGIDPLIGVRAVAVQVTVPIRGASVREEDHDLMLSLRSIAPEVEGSVWVLDASLGMALLGVDEVRELDGILDEEHGGVVANHIVVALLGVELDGESSWITVAVVGTALASDSGESQENGGLLADLVKEGSLSEPSHVVGHFAVSVGSCAFSVDHTLGNALTSEVSKFVDQVEILDQERAAWAGAHGVLVVVHR